MAFFKLRSKGSPGKEGRGNVSAAPAESVESLRRRARHRLVGAAVLVLLGVIGFPLLFDTQPRPVAVDIPIEMPDRAKVKPLAQAEAPAADTSRSASGGIALPPPANGVITERADGSEVAVAPPAAVPEPRREAVASSEPAKSEAPRTEPARVDAKPEPKPEPAKTPVTKSEAPKTEAKSEVAKAEPSKPEPAKPASPAPAPGRDDGARARALLEGKAPSSRSWRRHSPRPQHPPRSPDALWSRWAPSPTPPKPRKRARSWSVPVSRRTPMWRRRPRASAPGCGSGPFSSRADADKAAARIKALALPAAVLTL